MEIKKNKPLNYIIIFSILILNLFFNGYDGIAFAQLNLKSCMDEALTLIPNEYKSKDLKEKIDRMEEISSNNWKKIEKLRKQTQRAIISIDDKLKVIANNNKNIKVELEQKRQKLIDDLRDAEDAFQQAQKVLAANRDFYAEQILNEVERVNLSLTVHKNYQLQTSDYMSGRFNNVQHLLLEEKWAKEQEQRFIDRDILLESMAKDWYDKTHFRPNNFDYFYAVLRRFSSSMTIKETQTFFEMFSRRYIAEYPEMSGQKMGVRLMGEVADQVLKSRPEDYQKFLNKKNTFPNA